MFLLHEHQHLNASKTNQYCLIGGLNFVLVLLLMPYFAFFLFDVSLMLVCVLLIIIEDGRKFRINFKKLAFQQMAVDEGMMITKTLSAITK